MMIKRLLNTAVVLGMIPLAAQHVYAQEVQGAQDIPLTKNQSGIGIGIKFGGSVTRLAFDYDEGFEPSETNYRGLLGLQAGVYAEINFGALSIQPEILYARQGGRTVRNRGNELVIHYILDYVQIPLLLKYKISSRFVGYLGPQIGFLLNARTVREDAGVVVGGGTKVQIFDFNAQGTPMKDGDGVLRVIEENIVDYFDKIDVSIAFGLGYQFSSGLGVDFRYSLGLLDPISEKIRVSQRKTVTTTGTTFEGTSPLTLVTEARAFSDNSITNDTALDDDGDPLRAVYRPDDDDLVSARNHLFQLSISYTFKF